jgi:APA family basic amino acid/polyamine antiporter
LVGGPPQPHFVQGMGLFSATAIVMGSMIGSGIFIVPADMSRVLGSPALLIAAWLVTALMTIIGALSYGELAAMMPKAGGQYVYLRESLGPIWGFLYGWTLFLVIQTGTIAAVGVAFGKFLGVFFPSVSASRWLWHVGTGNIGLSTANLAAILVIVLLTWLNTQGVKLGAAVQNVFTSAKVLALLGIVAVGLVARECDGHCGELRCGMARVLGRRGLAVNAACGPGRRGRPGCLRGNLYGARGRAGRFAIFE